MSPSSKSCKMMKTSLWSTLLLTFFCSCFGELDATFAGCDQQKGQHSIREKNGYVPGLYVVTANLPGATYNRDGSLNRRSIACAHEDSRTSGGSIVIPWASFDKRDGKGGGQFDWTFVEEQMKPWVDRNQTVNILIWPAVQKADQQFMDGLSATPQYILDLPDITYECPDGSAQSHISEGIPLPKMWEKAVWEKYAQALITFVRTYENHPHISYFRFGIGVGAESYPGNGATTPTNWCMNTFVNVFEGDSYNEKAQNAYDTWTNYVKHRVRAYRRWNSKKPIVVTVNHFYTLKEQNKDTFPNMIAHEATREYNGHPMLGLGVQGATTRDIDLWNRGKNCYANWCNLFDERKHLGVPLQLQTPLHSGVNGRPSNSHPMEECRNGNNGLFGCTSTGNMKELIDFGRQRGVDSWELYAYEWFVANDKSFSKNRQELNWHKQFGGQYNYAFDEVCNKVQVKNLVR